MRLFISLSRNLLDDVKLQCNKLADLSNDAAVKRWVTTVFKNWVANEAPATEVETLDESAPAWAQEAMKKKDLLKVDWAQVQATLRPIIDYLHSLAEAKESFDKLSVPDAIKKQKEWHESLTKGAKNLDAEEDGIETVIELPNGYAWRKLTGEKTLDREGDLMGHCVGGDHYFKEVSDGTKTIYSLRDAKNEPHITIEVVSSDIAQIKGKANGDVVAKYRPMIFPFFKLQEWKNISLDTSGIRSREARAWFVKNNLVRKADKAQPLLAIKLARGKMLRVFDSKKPLEYPCFDEGEYHDSTYILKCGNRIHTVAQSYQPINEVGAIETALGIELTDTDQLNIVCQTRKEHLYLGLRIDPFALAKVCCTAGKKYGTEFILAKADERAAILLQGPTEYVLFQPKAQKIIATQFSGKLQPISATISKLTDTQLAQIAPLLVGPAIPKSLQLRLLKLKQAAIPSAKLGAKSIRRASLSWKKAPPELLAALKLYRGSKATTYAPELDTAETVAELKTILRENQLKASGYLYEYFDTFFALLMMTNKNVAAEAILNTPGLLRQLNAFTTGLASIKAGGFWRTNTGSKKAEQRLMDAYATISSFVPKLLPLTDAEKQTLLSIRGTPAFKKYVASNW